MNLGRVLRPFAVAFLAILFAACPTWAEPLGNAIAFDSHNYDSVQDFLIGRQSGDAKVKGYLSMPSNATGKSPAAVILPDANGISDDDFEYARVLNEAGIATLVLDEYGDRRARSHDDSMNPTRAADAFFSLRFLAANRAIDATRIAVVGFSQGGVAAYLTAVEPARRALLGSNSTLHFAAHAAFYPNARSLVVGDNVLGKAPIRFFFAREDSVAPLQPWLDYFAVLKTSRVDWRMEQEVYDGGHGFERGYARKTDRAFPNSSRCQPVYYRLQGGRMEIFRLTAGRLVAMTRNEVNTANCAIPGGVIGRTIESARTRAFDDLKAFLARAFAPTP